MLKGFGISIEMYKMKVISVGETIVSENNVSITSVLDWKNYTETFQTFFKFKI